MNQRLKKIISLLCLMTMLFGNCSLDSLFSSSNQNALAESIPANPMKRVDATMHIGETKRGSIQDGETYNIRLAAKKGEVMTLVASGMRPSSHSP